MEEKVCKWVKLGGGVLYLRSGKRIKPKEIFFAPESDIPVNFRDTVKLLQKDVDVEKANISFVRTKKKGEGPVFQKVQREDGLFDVVDYKGKIINEEPLEELDADRLLYVLED